MTIPNFLLSNLLRHSRSVRILSSNSSTCISSLYSSYHISATQFHNYTPHTPSVYLCTPRYFSSHDTNINMESDSVVTQLDVPESGLGTQIGEQIISGDDAILPVQALISMLDGYHDLTGFPWWIVIGSATLALRMALFPLLILQLNKLKRIAELFPKLPPPLPPPLSERSFKDQFTLFWNERRAVGCPSFLWFMAYISVQFPCFLLWMTTVRKMSLDHHSGFECGGALWFQNLSELPHGVYGSIFPLMIAGLHFVNVQISFQTASTGKVSGLLGFLVKSYKFYLDVMTLPILVAGFCVPQGSSVYWLTNSFITLIQQLCLNDPNVRHHLGLPEMMDLGTTKDARNVVAPVTFSNLSHKQHKLSVRNRSPSDLVMLSVQLLEKKHKERAIQLLRLALDKDPEHVRALIIMGQTLLQDGMLVEAIEHLEHAISRLLLQGYPTEIEEVDLLIAASQWAGSCYVQQGKYAEALIHFERFGRIKEPEDSTSKSHYYDGLVMLASALSHEDRKAEAAKYLRRAVAFNPSYKVYLEELENEDSFASDLVNSRRGDY
ncbi:hypothetical protein DCAR_0103545 [Daucus carota subsp. sativus]|uniref:ALBINO3-like protein 2, chloroplastic n=2 Tax=Daucus carota subsp. sativus TaxID=79200 RepID=A0AAF1AL12_DAUCS|nr:PREDICTED: ALBINO3-like protein 2, chloroplastic isoform X1 [Daucus carota subsp. sativus]WOG84362.1 hypothetical protein DCAR_0103545 [Daucus carota subsp. sativus]